ncbi:hypothetical protein EJ04DRAFT_274927 [Polyplosphaeria fusca]|uniref:Uncharacterized protein n=1 Tax=Polyplosphaeria fusca TaxID=682080 RepID=A0A9P4QYG3_9PLEO|nr:hypothetical protein EJ04DRAFT_274927 [Polyplosphaeria fusca]
MLDPHIEPFGPPKLVDQISNPTEFIPIHYSGDPIPDIGKVVRITTFKRHVFLGLNRAQQADFEEFSWVIKFTDAETWNLRPSAASRKSMSLTQAAANGDAFLPPIETPNPVAQDVPKVWASGALTTPTDDDIYDCTAGHQLEDDYTGACHHCTDAKSEALDSTSLVYYMVLSTTQSRDDYMEMKNDDSRGRQIYRLVKCGSREAAVAEAFYAAGVQRWNVVFSCVMKLGETFEERRFAIAERVEELWQLAEESKDGSKVRVFY